MQAMVDTFKTRSALHEKLSEISLEAMSLDPEQARLYADLVELEHCLWMQDDEIRNVAERLKLENYLRWN